MNLLVQLSFNYDAIFYYLSLYSPFAKDKCNLLDFICMGPVELQIEKMKRLSSVMKKPCAIRK